MKQLPLSIDFTGTSDTLPSGSFDFMLTVYNKDFVLTDLITANHLYDYSAQKFQYICFSGAIARDFLNNIGFSEFNVIKKNELKYYDDIASLFDKIIAEYNIHDNLSYLKCNVWLCKLLIQMHYAFVPEYDDNMQHQRTMLAPIFELIHNRSHSIDISLQVMSDYAGISPMHIIRSFKTVTSDTPAHFISNKKMKDAKKALLTDIETPIAEIAHNNGFISANAFNSLFKKEYGITPGEYRKIHKDQPLPSEMNYRPLWQPLYICNVRKYDNIREINHISPPPTAYRLTLITNGSGIFTCEDGNEHVLCRNELFFNPELNKYSCKALTRPFGIIEISFNGVYEKDIINAFCLNRQTCFRHTTDIKYDFYHAANFIWRNFWTFDKEALLECSYTILEILLKLYECSQKSINVTDTASPFPAAINIIEMYYMNNLSVSELAEAIGIPQTVFTAKFKQYYKMSPKKYIDMYRLQKAADTLVKYPGMTLSEVAVQNGFSSSSYFCSAFKKNFGVTPNQYRCKMTIKEKDKL